MVFNEKQALIDLQYLDETYGMDLLIELVEILEKQKIEILNDWRSGKNLSEFELSQASHKIKSSARNVGAAQLGAIFNAIENNPNPRNALANIDLIEDLFQQYSIFFLQWKRSRGAA